MQLIISRDEYDDKIHNFNQTDLTQKSNDPTNIFQSKPNNF